MELAIVTGASVLLQIAAVLAALRLIGITKAGAAWILLSLAIAGMGVRRLMTLYNVLAGRGAYPLEMLHETVGLFTSLFMFAGILSIGPIFRSAREKEAALKKSEARYRTIVETSQEGIWAIDREGTTRFVNRRMAEMLGYPREEMLGRPIADFMRKDGPSVQAGIVERRMRGIREQYDLLLSRKDGSDFWGIFSAAPVLDERGKFDGAFAMVTDVTERKKLEAERDVMVASLNEAFSSVKTLRGLLPICASCKKIRDDKGYWNQIEGYISAHTEAEFSHSICPECREKLYPGFTGP